VTSHEVGPITAGRTVTVGWEGLASLSGG